MSKCSTVCIRFQKSPIFITETTQSSFLAGKSPLLQGDKFPVLSVLPMSVKVFVEIVDSFVKVVQVLKEHSASHHLLLTDTTLQFISFPSSKPYWALDQFFWMLFEIPQDPNVVIYTKQCSLLVPAINHFGRWKSEPYMERQWNTQREASAGRGHPAPQSPTCRPRDAPCHYSSLPTSVGTANQPGK